MVSNNHWPTLNSILDEHQIEAINSLETTNWQQKTHRNQSCGLLVHDLRTNQNSTKCRN